MDDLNDKNKIIATFYVFVAIAILSLIVCVIGFDYVPAGHVGVLDKMGQVKEVPLQPGVWWTGMLTQTNVFSIQEQKVEYAAGAASRDMQTVNTKVALNFRLKPDIAVFMYKNIGTNYEPVIISPVIQEVVKANTAKYTAEELVTKRDLVKTDITSQLISTLEEKGLIVVNVAMTDFAYSDEFNKAIESKVTAEQKALEAKNKYDEMEWTSKAMKLQSEVLEIKKLDLQEKWISRWDGKLPQTVITGDDKNSNFLLGLNGVNQ